MILTHHGTNSLDVSGGGGTEHEVQIGMLAQSYNKEFPWNGNYKYSLSQQMYKSSEIKTSGTITDIQFWCYYGALTWNLSIYMSHTDLTNFAVVNSKKLSNSTDIADSTLVFNGDVPLSINNALTWVKIHLTNPFHYDMSHNLLITVTSKNPNNAKTPLEFAGFNYSQSNVVCYKGRDTSEYTPMTMSYSVDKSDYKRNCIKLNMLI